MQNVTGKVWLVGAGPGDPGLITVRGLEVLGQAQVVLHDALSHPALLDACHADAEIRNVGKRAGGRYPPQSQITDQLIELARAGKRVVRLKGGDPLVFARGSEEATDLAAAGVPFEIVPGVSSPVATSAYAGIALTHRNLSSSVTFITGSDAAEREWSPDAWRRLATATETICVLMGMRRIEPITQAIIDGGRDPSTPAVVIQWGARPEQRVVEAPLDGIAAASKAAGLTNPAVIVIGRVVELRSKLRWFDNRPLFGKRILVPRAKHQAAQTAKAIRERAAEPVVFPVIEIADPPGDGLSRAVRALASYDWVLFTSTNGVDRSFDAIRRAGLDARAFGSAKVAVIGPRTAAALERWGVRADVVAEEFVGEGLARALVGRGAPLGRVLMLRAAVAREALPEALREAGAEVDVVAAYETRKIRGAPAEALRERLRSGELDVVTFTSSSTVDSVVEALGDDAAEVLASVTVASIGPVTTERAKSRGVRVDVTASVFTVAGLLDALESHFVP